VGRYFRADTQNSPSLQDRIQTTISNEDFSTEYTFRENYFMKEKISGNALKNSLFYSENTQIHQWIH
jgi:hypothetical protein